MSKTKWRVVKKLGKGDYWVELEVSQYAQNKDDSLPKTVNVRYRSAQKIAPSCSPQ